MHGTEDLRLLQLAYGTSATCSCLCTYLCCHPIPNMLCCHLRYLFCWTKTSHGPKTFHYHSRSRHSLPGCTVAFSFSAAQPCSLAHPGPGLQGVTAVGKKVINHNQCLCLTALCLPRRPARGCRDHIVCVPRAVPHYPRHPQSTMQLSYPLARHDWT